MLAEWKISLTVHSCSVRAVVAAVGRRGWIRLAVRSVSANFSNRYTCFSDKVVQINGLIDRQTYRQTDMPEDRQTYPQTNRQTITLTSPRKWKMKSGVNFENVLARSYCLPQKLGSNACHKQLRL